MIFLNLDEAESEQDIIDFYNLYRNSNLTELPNSFWTNPKGRYRAKVIVEYLIQEILQYKRRIHIIHKLSISDFKNNKLSNMMALLFNNNVFLAVDNVYPNIYKECMFKGKRNYWDAELLIEEMEIIAKKLNKDPQKE